MNSELLKNFVKKAKRRLVGRENVSVPKIKIIPNDDEALKNKVVFLMEQDDIVTNPVSYLIDGKKMENMDDEQRERYLFSTLDRYAKLRKEMQNLGQYNSRCM